MKNNQMWLIISLLLGLMIACESLALYSVQKYSKTNQKIFIVISMLVYGICIPLLLVKLLKYKGVGMINFLWNIFSTIAGFAIGIMLFQERVGSLQLIGVMLGILAFGLIIFGDKQVDKKSSSI
jgi:multidrug transporter EmrE-like cation transporter